MEIKDFVDVVSALPETQSVIISGVHGIGKSDVVRQFSASKDADCIDIRAGECELADLIGMPYIEGGKTMYAHPWWWNQLLQNDSKGRNTVLFFDEINRAQKDVRQALFELILDRRMYGKPIPNNAKVWIFSAINPSGEYDVQDLDCAFFDRFMSIDLRPSVAEWLDWAAKNNIHKAVYKFVEKNSQMLDPPEKDLEQGRKYPSRRSWSKFSKALVAFEESVGGPRGLKDTKNLGILGLMASGFIGLEVSTKFIDFVIKNYNQLSAMDIIEGMGRKEIKDKVENIKANHAETSALVNEIISIAGSKVEKKETWTKKHLKNVGDFIVLCPQDVVAMFFSKLSQDQTYADFLSKVTVDNNELQSAICAATATQFKV